MGNLLIERVDDKVIVWSEQSGSYHVVYRARVDAVFDAGSRDYYNFIDNIHTADKPRFNAMKTLAPPALLKITSASASTGVPTHTYVYVGDHVYEFESPAITLYKSFEQHGRNYAYAVAGDNVLLLDYCVVLNNPPFNVYDDDFNPYLYYDALSLLTTQTTKINPQHVYVGGIQRHLYHSTIPEFEYDQMTACGNITMETRFSDGKRNPVDKSDFVEMMRDFESANNIHRLTNTPLYA